MSEGDENDRKQAPEVEPEAAPKVAESAAGAATPLDDTEPSAPELDAEGQNEMKRLVRGAFKEPPPESDVLRGVQRRLRERSGGKFYDDEWSTSKRTPIGLYLVTSALMLAVVLVAYAVMGFFRDTPKPVDNTPAPVQIVFPKPK